MTTAKDTEFLGYLIQPVTGTTSIPAAKGPNNGVQTHHHHHCCCFLMPDETVWMIYCQSPDTTADRGLRSLQTRRNDYVLYKNVPTSR